MPRSFPFPIPDGWFQLAYADELTPGEVRPLRYFGQDLVLFRTESGEPRVLDAFCPHLGAHLGHGGQVAGESLRCPFHAWRFDGDGQCVEVPYARKIPARARLRSWPVVERNRAIWCWHHAEQKPPGWDVPELPEVDDPEWTPFRLHRWTVRTRNQEMAENAVDRAHFTYVHGTKNLPASELSIEGPVMRSIQRAQMQTPRGIVDGKIESVSHGFGCSHIRFSGICDTLLMTSTTPIDEEQVDVRFAFTVKADGTDTERGVGAAIIADIVKQLDEDIPIWENKIYRPRPMLCDGDGPIGRFRTWSQQFYS